MSEFLAKTKASIIVGIFTLLLLVYFLTGKRPYDRRLNEKLKKLEELECTNDSLRDVNRSLDTVIAKLYFREDSLEAVITQSQKQLSDLKQRAHEKLAAIDSFSVDELERFFADYSAK